MLAHQLLRKKLFYMRLRKMGNGVGIKMEIKKLILDTLGNINGKPNGKGSILFPDGAEYHGELKMAN